MHAQPSPLFPIPCIHTAQTKTKTHADTNTYTEIYMHTYTHTMIIHIKTEHRKCVHPSHLSINVLHARTHTHSPFITMIIHIKIKHSVFILQIYPHLCFTHTHSLSLSLSLSLSHTHNHHHQACKACSFCTTICINILHLYPHSLSALRHQHPHLQLYIHLSVPDMVPHDVGQRCSACDVQCVHLRPHRQQQLHTFHVPGHSCPLAVGKK